MEKNRDWILYGAYGFTGRLLVEEAVRRGHRPLLAGRSSKKLALLAAQYDLQWRAFSLDDRAALGGTVRKAALVFHAAGPFVHTAHPMREACLEAGSHYIDITGELPVFQATYALHDRALKAGIVMVSGAGMDVIPSDCLAAYAASKVPGANWLETAIASSGSAVSAGTLKSSLEMAPRGGLRRQNGMLVPHPLGKGNKVVRFHDRERTVLPVSWGDLEAAYRCTAIPNITSYLAFPPRLIGIVERFGGILRLMMSAAPLRRLLQRLASRAAKGPTEAQRREGRTRFWACASAPDGRRFEAGLESLEAYRLTAEAGVRTIEKLLENPKTGALSPAQAFGMDFILEIPDTRRYDLNQK
jgi:short subunit dehydrogenase-like uncharacterized protein